MRKGTRPSTAISVRSAVIVGRGQSIHRRGLFAVCDDHTTIVMASSQSHARPATMSRRKALLSISALLLPSVSAQVQQYSGCYSSSAPLTNQGYWQYQSEGYCEPICSGQGAAVYALSDAAYCWCGNELPAESALVSNSSCSMPCAGYPSNICGGDGFYSVFLTGVSLNVQHYGGSNSASSSTSSSKQTTAKGTPQQTTRTHPSVVTATAPGTTVVQTVQGDQPTGSSSSSIGSNSGSGSTNTAGIAAGVVVGIVGAAALIGSVVYYLRRRKQRDIEEEHKRHTQVANLRSGERRLSMTGYSQMSDSRLDPGTRVNRNSQGSIADNQDYSRRILRVANPDSS